MPANGTVTATTSAPATESRVLSAERLDVGTERLLARSTAAAARSAARDPTVTLWPAWSSRSLSPNPSAPVPPTIVTRIAEEYRLHRSAVVREDGGHAADRLPGDRADAPRPPPEDARSREAEA